MENFDTIIEKIVKTDPKYPKGAYSFVREALEFTVKNISPENLANQTRQHITGQKLLEGIREYALLQYGPMTLTVFNRWHIQNCEDFGNIVYKMIENNILGKTDHDSKEDFKNGFDFYEAFQKPFIANTNPPHKPNHEK